MNPRIKVWTLCVAVVIVLSLGGCKSGDMDQDIILTFDGEECKYDGPSVVTAGDRVMTLKNTTEHESQLIVVKLDEGKTWQDMIDFVGEPGSAPGWLPGVSTVMTTFVPDNPEAREYSLQDGLYAIFCVDIEDRIWPGAPLEVKED
jgi:hypothetical protein